MLSILCLTQADLFDDLVDGLHKRIIHCADFLKNVAAPRVREKFIETKDIVEKLKADDIHLWIAKVGAIFTTFSS
ncbi:unnamed protein product [Onchocerca flexuosa]|uniref:DHC_N1 domain-containing protein n=1 Tax=Onchocerca flexuosa TaxID=387005 RepID=A0A183I5M4_9BILA|nr:unnamed protein product [Onchocerca flexuosa]